MLIFLKMKIKRIDSYFITHKNKLLNFINELKWNLL